VFGDEGLVVEGDHGEEVVSDVVVRDVVEEEAADPAEEGTIDGTDGTTEERPFVLAVVRHRGVGVMEEGQHDDPVVGKEVRNEVFAEEVEDTILVGVVGESAGHGRETNVGDDDGETLFGFEEGG